MAHSSLITLTEVYNTKRAATMAEKGWGHYSAGGSSDANDCAILWRNDTWRKKQGFVRKLTSVRYTRPIANKPGPPVWACCALLKNVNTEQTLLVSVSHMPVGIEGHWNDANEQWKARKLAYTDAMTHWSTLVEQLETKYKPSGVLVCADWNLDLKDGWVRDYLGSHWNKKCGLHRAWVTFPTSGGSLGGNRIIDGSYTGGMAVTNEPELMARVRSSDHRPYKESFKIVSTVMTKPKDFYNPATGHIGPGVEWWGFGDYQYDEMFEKVDETPEGTVVTFDFGKLYEVLGDDR